MFPPLIQDTVKGGGTIDDLCSDNIIIFIVTHIYVCVCVCVCYWPPVRGVCPNYEVLDFQPWTVTPPKLRILCLLLHIYP